MMKFQLDIENGLEPLEIDAKSNKEAADWAFANLSTEIVSVREVGKETWADYDFRSSRNQNKENHR